MKKAYHFVALGCTAAAGAGLLTLAAPAFADTPVSTSYVSLYGIIDTSIEFLNNAATVGGSSRNVTRMSSGGLSGSRWGLTGSEDLGGGNNAFFQLENGFNSANGMTTIGNREFSRLAYVGLASRTFGKVYLGRQDGLMQDLLAKFSPSGNSVYGLKMQEPALSDRLDNAIRYEQHIGRVTAVAQYSLGYDTSSYGAQPPGDTRLGQVLEGGLTYAAGNVTATLIYDQKNGSSTSPAAAHTTKIGGYEGDIDRRIALAVKYRWSNLDLFAGYRYLDSRAIHLSALSTGPVEVAKFYWAGATYHFTPAFSLAGNLMYQDFAGTTRDPVSFQLVSDYQLSKRTDVYLNGAFVENRHGADLGVNGFDTNVVNGKNQLGFMAGIRHAF